MENRIDNIVEQIFKKEFFCEDVETAKEKAIAAFRKKYEELLPEHSPIQAMGVSLRCGLSVVRRRHFSGVT